ncbi:YqiA/YcfP family alpha/beta fold hydrolase [Ideonella sp. BN130291]|uniref:YqiA/YcfP family alpha/beta fold hydrolase n=1 Tax=Ideonella sp. BN130291 TaxID=3112940 RepID=UPI003FA54542
MKARMVAAWMATHRPDVAWWCPQLPPSPRAAMQQVMAGIAAWPSGHMAVIGSSLGGFYATAVAEATGCRAVLLNPAVDPARDLAAHIGEQTTWQNPQDRFFFRAEFIEELRALTVPAITLPDRYFAVIAKGDEVLDWHEMRGRYPGADVKLLEGSDHALSDFDQHLPDVLRFLHLG